MAHILVADDDAEQIAMHRRLLETLGYQVSTAQSREEALQEFARERPAVVVIDLRLPLVSDGLDLIREVRQRDGAVPVIVLSGWPDDIYGTPEEPLISRILVKGNVRNLLQTIAEYLPAPAV